MSTIGSFPSTARTGKIFEEMEKKSGNCYSCCFSTRNGFCFWLDVSDFNFSKNDIHRSSYGNRSFFANRVIFRFSTFDCFIQCTKFNKHELTVVVKTVKTKTNHIFSLLN